MSATECTCWNVDQTVFTHNPTCPRHQYVDPHVEIDRLRASNGRLIEALRPFACIDSNGISVCRAVPEDYDNAARVLREETKP